MRRHVYDELVYLLNLSVGACPNYRLLLTRYGDAGVTKEALVSLFGQETQSRVIKSNHLIKQRIHAYTDRYLSGTDILVLSMEVDFPPCMLIRRILEHLLPGSKQVIGDVLKQPSRLDSLLSIQQTSNAGTTHSEGPTDYISAASKPGYLTTKMVERMKTDIKRCVMCDSSYSPLSDLARQAAGLEYELLLSDMLKAAGITWFWTENELRAQGCFKTPDVRLQVPIAVRSKIGNNHSSANGASEQQWRVVTWIDSKATFGDDRIHVRQLQDQYLTYVNRYGPGLVIYWFGFIDDLDTHPDVLLMDHFPTAEELQVLPQLKPSGS